MSRVIDGCVVFTQTQKRCYDWLISQKDIEGVIQLAPNGDWARVILHGEETSIPNPLGWSRKDFYE